MKKTLTVMMVLLLAAGMAFANGQSEDAADAAPQFSRPGYRQTGSFGYGNVGLGQFGRSGRQGAAGPRDPQQAYQAAAEFLERAEEATLTGSFALTRDVPTIVTSDGTFAIAGPGVGRYARMLEEGTEMELSGLLIRPEIDVPLVIDGSMHVTSAVIAGETIELDDLAAGPGTRGGGPRGGFFGPGRTMGGRMMGGRF